MNIKEFIKSKETAWRFLFLDENGQGINRQGKVALADLREFCFATKTAFDTDALEMARRMGRKEVFDRIMTYLNIDYSKYYELEEEYNDE